MMFVGKLYSLCRFSEFSGRSNSALVGRVSRLGVNWAVDDLSIIIEASISVVSSIKQAVVNFFTFISKFNIVINL